MEVHFHAIKFGYQAGSFSLEYAHARNEGRALFGTADFPQPISGPFAIRDGHELGLCHLNSTIPVYEAAALDSD